MKIQRPKMLPGIMEIEGIGFFPINNVPKWAYRRQKIIVGSFMILTAIVMMWWLFLPFIIF